ncbi:MAG TPA: hypothetical protein VN684_13315 [Terriglobales bacterium]|nr:hypothetical protein [Terriglobales bacterium]
MTPESMGRALEEFLQGSNRATVRENGNEVFDLSEAKYSVTGEYNRCLLHLWSAERSLVRRIVDMEVKSDVLRLAVQKLGQSKPTRLEICRIRDLRTPNDKRAARLAYRHKLKRILERHFAGYTIGDLRTSADLERSFGPVYCRGLIHRGQSAFAVFGVNAKETQSSIDAALTFGILWLDLCRLNHAGKMVVEGLKLFIPAKSSALTLQRMAHLHPDAARWQLYEFDEYEDLLRPMDLADRGNFNTRLVQFPDQDAVRRRFADAITRVRNWMPEVEIAVLSSAEIAFRRFGLEFAKARLAHDPRNFRTAAEVVFGLGSSERTLNDANEQEFVRLVCSIGEVRHPEGPRDHPLWRSHPERWLESLVANNISMLDERLEALPAYSQMPAFSAADRAMIDVLAVTRSGRLAVVELKTSEDIHLPLQGVDYWSRVAWHHSRGEFQRFGYFSGHELSAEQPQLILVAPALHIHPATDTLLRYISPQIDWTLIGIDERWREQVKVMFRKRAPRVEKPMKIAS